MCARFSCDWTKNVKGLTMRWLPIWLFAFENFLVVFACVGWKYNEQRDNYKTDSGVTLIEAVFDDPFDMFNEWFNEARSSDVSLPGAFTFATATHEGKVSARTLQLRRIENDGFAILTVKNSRKARDLVEIPDAAMVFKWEYFKRGRKVVRQVRMEVKVEELEPRQFQALYEEEPLYMKLQYTVCQQGQISEWHEIKERHDALWMEVVGEGKELPMPDRMVGYKLVPGVFEFYSAVGSTIADRIVYVKSAGNEWTHHRLAA